MTCPWWSASNSVTLGVMVDLLLRLHSLSPVLCVVVVVYCVYLPPRLSSSPLFIWSPTTRTCRVIMQLSSVLIESHLCTVLYCHIVLPNLLWFDSSNRKAKSRFIIFYKPERNSSFPYFHFTAGGLNSCIPTIPTQIKKCEGTLIKHNGWPLSTSSGEHF